MGGLMDPLSIIVLAIIIGAGADLATGGRVRAEFGGGARGAAGYVGSAGRKRWQESKRLARQERMKTPTGRAVQAILDELGGLGRGLVRGWRSGARRGRKQWRECLNGQPIPAVRAWRGLSEKARLWGGADPNAGSGPLRCSWTVSPFGLAAFGYQKSCGQPATDGPFCAKHAEEMKTTRCTYCGHLMGTGPDCSDCQALQTVMGGPYGPLPNVPNGAGQDPIEARTDTPNGDPEQEAEQDPEQPERAWWDPNGITDDPFLDGPEQDPNGNPDDDPMPPRCPDCGMPIVIDDLNAHRLGRDRCPYADPNDAPNGEPMPGVERFYLEVFGSAGAEEHGEIDLQIDASFPGTGDAPTAAAAEWAARRMKSMPPGSLGMLWAYPEDEDGDAEYVNTFDGPPPNGTSPTDPPVGTGPAGTTTRTEGTTVADINSAPAAIALFAAFRGRFEEPESLLTALRDEIAAAADAMGDFAIGGEGDLAAGPQAALDAVVQAKEALDAYLSALHLEYDASIEAAEAKQADAHRPMQEV